jgi:hypothetical protein
VHVRACESGLVGPATSVAIGLLGYSAQCYHRAARNLSSLLADRDSREVPPAVSGSGGRGPDGRLRIAGAALVRERQRCPTTTLWGTAWLLEDDRACTQEVVEHAHR